MRETNRFVLFVVTILCYGYEGSVIVDKVGDMCYYISTGPVKWYKAIDLCAELHMELATIQSMEEQELITDYLLQSQSFKNNTFTWLDGTDIGEETNWKWMNSNERFNFTAWAVDEPNNYFNEDCLAIKSELGNNWYDRQCSRKYQVLCQVSIQTGNTEQTSTTETEIVSTIATIDLLDIELPGPIFDDYSTPLQNYNNHHTMDQTEELQSTTLIDRTVNRRSPTVSSDLPTFNGYQYYFHKSTPWKTWEESKKYCNHLGMDLATIYDEKTNEFLFNYLKVNLLYEANFITGNIINFWLDAHKEKGEIDWKWSNTSDIFRYAAWNGNQRFLNIDEACLEMRKRLNAQSSWSSADCKLKQRFICQRKISSIETTIMSFPPMESTLKYDNTLFDTEDSTSTPPIENCNQKLSFTQENGSLFLFLFVLLIIAMVIMIITFSVTFKRMKHRYLSFRTKYCGILQRVEQDDG